MADRRSSFGPVVLLGLAAGALVAVSGTRAWVVPHAEGADTAALVGYAAANGDAGELPVATSLALVCLACWGVVLVARGRARRAVGVLGLLAAAGLVAAVVVAWLTLGDTVREDLATTISSGVTTESTRWAWSGSVGAVVALAAAGIGLRAMGSWPEMGSRYDAPGGTAGSAAEVDTPLDEQSNLDLWRAIDEGRDPTA